MTALFGPQAANAATTLPGGTISQRYGSTQTWVQDASAPGAADGTVVDAAWYNRIIGNLEYLISTSGIAATPGDMSAVYRAVMASLAAGAPDTLNTLKELADAIGDDKNFSSTILAGLNVRARFDIQQFLSPIQKAQLRTNIGLGTCVLYDVGIHAYNIVQIDQNGKLPGIDGSQLTNVTAAWGSLTGVPAFGTASLQNVGTAAGNVVQLTAGAKLPAVDGSQLTNVVSTQVSTKNYVINGGMRVSQEHGATAVAGTGQFPVDMFCVFHSTDGAFSAQQVAVATPGGSSKRLRFTVTTADTSIAAGQYVQIATFIEGIEAAEFMFGTGAAKQLTYRMGIKAPAGVYCVCVQNAAGNRSYVGEVTIAAGEANTDVVKTVALTAGDTAGTWLNGEGQTGVRVTLALAAGTTYQAAANAWVASNTFATSNQFNFMGANGNVLELFDVGLYVGTSAPLYEMRTYRETLRDCQRFWEASYETGIAPGTASVNGQVQLYIYAPAGTSAGGKNETYTTQKARTVAPTLYSPVTGLSGKARDNVGTVDVTGAVNSYSTKNFVWAASQASSSGMSLTAHWVANARLS